MQGPKGDPGAAGKDGVTKTAHLIVAKTGEDLGTATGMAGDCAFNQVLGGETCFGTFRTIYFDQIDCKGNAFLGDSFAHVSQHFVGPAGEVYVFKAGQQSMTALSRWAPVQNMAPGCGNSSAQTYLFIVTLGDAGMATKAHDLAELTIDLR